MTLLQEAEQIINGPRRDAYGPVTDSFARIARTWTDILKTPISPLQVALCMIALKLHREANAHSRDNLLDLAGYTGLAAMLAEWEGATKPKLDPFPNGMGEVKWGVNLETHMKCPACKTEPLRKTYNSNDEVRYHCPKCQTHWTQDALKMHLGTD